MSLKGKVKLSNPNPSIQGFNPTIFDFDLIDGSESNPPVVPPVIEPPPVNPPAANLVVYNSPTDILSWSETVKIKSLAMSRSAGFTFTFDRALPENWKWRSNPDNPDENYQYTVWPAVFIDGVWYTSGIVQMWQNRANTGEFETASWNTEWRKNWCYDTRWGRMFDYSPHPGNRMAFLVSAGNARGVAGISSVKERSDIVVIELPNDDSGSWSF